MREKWRLRRCEGYAACFDVVRVLRFELKAATLRYAAAGGFNVLRTKRP